MTLFERIFGKKEASANTAKARLKVMLATERADCHIPYLEDLKREILEVVKKYTGTNTGNVNIRTEKNDDMDMLELEISLGKN